MKSVVLCGLLLLAVGLTFASTDRNRVPCYGERGRAQRCFPPFVNAAFNVPVEATNTCGRHGREDYCQQTGISGATKSCDVCDERDPAKAHPSKYLTDFHSVDNLSWWQSGTMMSDVQWPNMVNLTLSLGKSFEITYVRLKFHSSRPESFAIYKRSNETQQWQPYQFYSSSCYETYGMSVRTLIGRDNEATAVCRDDFSDISPLTGASVAFSTLEGRPSAYDFENSPVLQEWVTATDIRIVLNRINTFRDEVFGDPNVLRSYFYAISDFAVGGRCKCSGHASDCMKVTAQNLEERLVCQCQHNTTGPDCGECLPFYNDQPWQRATAADAHECQPCNCNGLSNRCYFDEELFRRTGHGGHCVDCKENTFGANCERCRDNYYRRSNVEKCQPCNCNPVGSSQLQCEVSGTCHCKPGVMGEKCDRCQANYYDFGPAGCRACQCFVAGCRNNRVECSSASGMCVCKENVEGQNCDQCKPGFFALSAEDPQGCLACFCFGHSSICTSSPGYTTRVIHSEFDSGVQRWRAETRNGQDVPTEFNARVQNLGVSAPNNDPIYFVAPDRYLGDHRFSYGLFLTFTLRVGDEGARASVEDIIIEGNGVRITAPIFAQQNPLPRTINQEYKYRLNEHPTYQWTPRLSSTEFVRLLSNITALKIRATYSPQGVGLIDSVKLQSAREGSGGTPASNVEQCTCPEGYVGQFCESCSPGYRRDPPSGGPLARCIPCNCNKHSDACDVATGRCICQHNTAGTNCEKCAPGFYGYALAGTPNDCKPCPCPDHGRCVQLLNGDVACIDCKEGYTGQRCEQCLDGYFGDPEGKSGTRRPCSKCICNNNIDSNAVGNCNRTTGECLKCIYNTAGFHCEKCLPNNYGDALALPKGQCKACACYAPGSVSLSGSWSAQDLCDQRTGQCNCRPNVVGRQCNQCQEGYWNIDSSAGCERCNCDRNGAINASCDVRTGSCYCKPGVGGKRCDRCMDNYYGLSRDGCKACNCNPDGSRTLQCDLVTGACDCQPNIGGQQCDRCQENKYNIAAGCLDCPVCYNVVQEQVNILRRQIHELREIIINIGGSDRPPIDDADFKRQLSIVNITVVKLWNDARRLSGVDMSLAGQVDIIRQAIDDIMNTCGHVSRDIIDSSRGEQTADIDTTAAERAVDAAENALREAERLLKNDGQNALKQAIDAQRQFGQQSNRMTQISREAREYTDRQVMESTTIEETAREALNTSNEAYRIAQEAIQKPASITSEINVIIRSVTDVDYLYNTTKRAAKAAQDQAQEAYRDALSIHTEADSLRIAVINVDSLKTESTQIKNEAGEIKDEANRLISQHESLMTDVERQMKEAADLLEDGNRQQQITDELLADADAARDMARKAIIKAESILREANETLWILKGFDRTVNESRRKADDAMKRIPEIERMIDDAEQKTREARDNLAGAERDAQEAWELAQQAQKIAEEADVESKDLRNKTTIISIQATTITEHSEQLNIDIDEIERRLRALEQQAEEDERLARDALEKADQATTSANSASSKVSGALNTVNQILVQLENLDRIDTSRLNELELNLTNAQRKLTDAQIDSRYSELEELSTQTSQWIYDYSHQLSDLTRDVENIRVINITIPRECFRKITLEPADPGKGR